MRQKYLISKDNGKDKLVIREFAELDKEMFSLLCEEVYDDEAIESSIAKGKASLISTLRTQNMYPSGLYADKIAESVITIYGSEKNQSTELFFDDIDLLTKDQKKPEVVKVIEKEPVEIDELLEDESEVHFDEDDFAKNAIKKNNLLIKVAEDEPADIEEES